MVLRNARDAYHVDLPIWFFAEDPWLSELARMGWTIVQRWSVAEDRITFDGHTIQYTGLLLRR